MKVAKELKMLLKELLNNGYQYMREGKHSHIFKHPKYGVFGFSKTPSNRRVIIIAMVQLRHILAEPATRL